MSTALKCPNPSCPYLFDPSTVPPGVVLACPRCGMRFTLGTPGAPPPATGANDPTATFPGGPTGTFPGSPPGYPTAPGYPPAGYAPPGYPAAAAPNPVEAAFGDMTPETAKADGEEGPRLPIRESKLQTILLTAVGAIALTAAGIAVWYKLTDKPEPPTATGDVVLYKGVNLSHERPARPPWVPDPDTKSKLDAPFIEVYKRENPEAFMAFAARDFKDHEPRRNELRQILVQALDKIIEPHPRNEYPDDIEKTWMGRDVTGFKFSGLLKGGGSVEGEAMAVSDKGVGYWFLSWTGSNEIFVEQKPAFAVGRAGCKLLGLREDWKPKVGSAIAHKNPSIGYTILDSEDSWDPIDDEAEVKGQDPKADKYLAIYAERTKRNKVFRAQLVVAVLDAVSDNPQKDARVHAESRANALAESQGKFVFREVTDPAEGDPTNHAEENTTATRFQVVNEKNPDNAYLYVVSGVRAGDKTVVLYAWCPWGYRAFVDTKMVQIARSLKSDK